MSTGSARNRERADPGGDAVGQAEIGDMRAADAVSAGSRPTTVRLWLSWGCAINHPRRLRRKPERALLRLPAPGSQWALILCKEIFAKISLQN